MAYLANRFPAAVEPYVGEEISYLRERGVRVIAGSVKSASQPGGPPSTTDFFCLQPVRLLDLLRALCFAIRGWKQISPFIIRVLFRGAESPTRRLKALAHTWLGAVYALRLKEFNVGHIHVHHGYFGSWIAMVAARLLGIDFSIMLHGSDLLVHGAYLDQKLKHCRFCMTVSEYNRKHILARFPEIDPEKIRVARLGVDLPPTPAASLSTLASDNRPFSLLAVGRLHSVKNHAFLIDACARLRDQDVLFDCAIAGEGPERKRLEALIRRHGLLGQVRLLGELPRERIDQLYLAADLVVLTSRSEGIPLVLMEAMARGRLVLAPAITGIPELIVPGKTGFTYRPDGMSDFLEKALFIRVLLRNGSRDPFSRTNWIRHAARMQILNNFHREKNLAQFCQMFMEHIRADSSKPCRSTPHENFVLQQI